MTQYPSEQPYGNDPRYAEPVGPRPKGLAIAALVLGILALLLCWTVVGGILFGLLAIVLGLIASGRAKRGVASGRGMAITGAVLGLIGLVLSGLLIALGASLLNSESGQNLRDCVEKAGGDQAQVDQCQREYEDEVNNGG